MLGVCCRVGPTGDPLLPLGRVVPGQDVTQLPSYRTLHPTHIATTTALACSQQLRLT